MKSLRSKLVGALVGVAGGIGVANAEQVIVYEAVGGSSQLVSASFAVKRELGRAWVDVQVQSSASSGEPVLYPPLEKHVDGLYYDSARKQVLYRTASEPIVCAEDATALWSTYLKSTGNCRLIPITEQREIDDGFDVREQTVARVVFDVQASSPLPTCDSARALIHRQ
ncbi:MAG TPA: hypothetical protein VKB87_09915 [Myxococcaceae bacterium]|nr:hypothetical protein [Myxococcaceae bacterium]